MAGHGVFKIGVVSDTHDHFDPQLRTLFEGVDHILHGGDIGLPWLIMQLEEIAPVTAVLGNTDDGGISFKSLETVELAARKFLVHHIVEPHALEEKLKKKIFRENPDVVVFGHTHRRFCEKIDGRLFLNPGYAGKPRQDLPRSVAILTCDAEGITADFLSL